jgi:hypothetical protein
MLQRRQITERRQQYRAQTRQYRQGKQGDHQPGGGSQHLSTLPGKGV